MYENLINHIVLWERRLMLENELRNAHQVSIAMNNSPEPDSCHAECRTIYNWNYKFEKYYQPLFNGFSQSCVAIPQLC